MQYIKETSDASVPGVRITGLDADELLAHAIAELEKKGYAPGFQLNECTYMNELKKLGLSADTLAEAWGIDAGIIEAYAENGENPSKWDNDRTLRELQIPISRIAVDAIRFALNPAGCARNLISKILHPQLSRVSEQQLSYSTIAKYIGVTADAVERFHRDGDENSLSSEEVSRLCIVLLIVDRELNYKMR